MLKLAAEVMQAASFVSGMYAAWLWLKASRVQPRPGPGIDAGLPELQRDAWLDALLRAASESGTLNRQAAVMTAAAVGAQAAVALLDHFAMMG